MSNIGQWFENYEIFVIDGKMMMQKLCADNSASLEEYPIHMKSMVKALAQSGWIMLNVLAVKVHLVHVKAMTGEMRTVVIVKIHPLYVVIKSDRPASINHCLLLVMFILLIMLESYS